jgi:hypothetical protein
VVLIADSRLISPQNIGFFSLRASSNRRDKFVSSTW